MKNIRTDNTFEMVVHGSGISGVVLLTLLSPNRWKTEDFLGTALTAFTETVGVATVLVRGDNDEMTFLFNSMPLSVSIESLS